MTTRYVRAMFAAAEVLIRMVAVDRFMLFSALAQPLFIGVTAMYMLRSRADFDPIYVVVGTGLTGLWTVALFTGAWNVQSERSSGTLELLVAAPVPLLVVMGGKMAGSMAFSLVSMALSYLIGAWLFGYELVVREPVGFAASLVLALVALWATGLLLSPLGVLWRAVQPFLLVLEYPVYTLAGFLFPILLLPLWLLPVSHLLPPYWAAVALHGTSSGSLATVELTLAWLFLMVGTVVAVAATNALYGVVLRRARAAGTLGLS